MFTDVLRAASILDIQRTRQLPFPGTVLVAEGDKVNPEDVIAETSLPKEIVMLDIARGLGVSQDEAETCIVREVGEALVEGDIIAQCEKPLPRLVRAPVDGRLVDVVHGQAVIAAGESSIQVSAGMIGDIVEVIPEYGAVIHAHGSLLQGVWGNGKIGKGTLYWVDSPPSTSIETSALDDLEKGQVLAGGLCLHVSVLESAQEKEAAGVILNAIAPELISSAMALSFPVIVLGGFGVLPVDQRTVDLLCSQAGKTACVNAAAADDVKGLRPEVIIPLEGKLTGEDLGFQSEIAAGRRVRILSGEFAGRVGEVEECLEEPFRFESGLEVNSAAICLDDGKSATLPQSNLVILE